MRRGGGVSHAGLGQGRLLLNSLRVRVRVHVRVYVANPRHYLRPGF